MNRIFTLIALLATSFIAKSDNYIESFNVLSDDYSNDIQDAQIIRPINGGTVISPIFDDSCPEYLKAPFSYACKIVEEYMPPCLPLKVKVSCSELKGSSANAISKVLARSKENFGASTSYNNAQMSVIKGVILSELCYNSTVTYLDSVPDIEFLTKDPDIEITYNSQKLYELSFSLDANPGQNYDFISLAVRDLLIGLGLSSSYRYNPVANELLNPSHELTPFETYIDKMLGNYDDPAARLSIATQGELLLQEDSSRSLKLFAPSTWRNGYSLNYFIPQDDCCASTILSYDFRKGMVTRSLADDYSHFIFYDLLGWRPNFPTGESTPSSSTAGSTSLLMPYNGSISFNNTTYGINTITNYDFKPRSVRMLNDSASENLQSYIDSFHPFLHNENNPPSEGISISVLKKDGNWDLVKFYGFGIDNMPFYMSDWTFHYDESEYARTIDGYLRARITTKKLVSGTGIKYNTKFFVIDYLPQKVKLSYEFVRSTATRATSTNDTVRIYFSDTEGVGRIVIEKLRQGNRVPTKISVTDVKKGYFDTTINKTTTFTAIGYNNNGTSRGVPITISPLSNALSLDFNLKDNSIYLKSGDQSDTEYSYSISTLDVSTPHETQSGFTSGIIDISTLSNGLYVLTIRDNNTGLSNTFKFKK